MSSSPVFRFLALYNFPMRPSRNIEIRKADWRVSGSDLLIDFVIKRRENNRALGARLKAEEEKKLRCSLFSGTDHVWGFRKYHML